MLGCRQREADSMELNGVKLPRDAALLFARLALASLFVLLGWQKLTAFGLTAAYMAQDGLPLPQLAAAIAVAMELGGGLLIALGVLVSPLALLMAAYTLLTGIVGHHYWTMQGALRADMFIHFWKNVAIAGGWVALSSAGPGRWALISR